MNWVEGFVLGLSTGMVCLAYCGPLLMPYLMGEGKKVLNSLVSVTLFLGGRLMAYLIVGMVAGLIGKAFFFPSETSDRIIAIAYVLLSVLMILYGFHRFGEICLGTKSKRLMKHTRLHWPELVPVAGGFASGLNICPPFLLAFTKAMDSGGIISALLFFMMFFLGTSVYFLPMPLVGLFRKHQVLKIIGKFAAILAGLYYFYVGVKLMIK